MNSNTAECLFRLYRAGRRPASRVQKAIRVAEQDEALRKRLGEQTNFDDQIVGVIQHIKPPENLRKKLREVSSTPVAKRSALWHIFNPAMLTAILGVLLIVGFVVWQAMERMEKFPGREAVERMLSATNKMSGVEMDPVSTTIGTLGDWFYMRGFEGYRPPEEMAALPVVGSRVFRQDGHPVAQMMVERRDSILYIFRASDFGVEMEPSSSWTLIEYQNWAAALRRHDDVCYMVAFKGGKPEMREFLQQLKNL
jgi:hypothetical protein